MLSRVPLGLMVIVCAAGVSAVACSGRALEVAAARRLTGEWALEGVGNSQITQTGTLGEKGLSSLPLNPELPALQFGSDGAFAMRGGILTHDSLFVGTWDVRSAKNGVVVVVVKAPPLRDGEFIFRFIDENKIAMLSPIGEAHYFRVLDQK